MRAPTKDDILNPFIFDNGFRSSNNGNNMGYNIYVSDLRYLQNFTTSQRNNVAFKFSENLPVGIYGFALVLTNQLVSISSDGERCFDLI